MQATLEKYFTSRKFNSDIVRKCVAIAALLSVVVLVAVFWWLKLVGITMAGEAFCGIPEHTHSEACAEKTLICSVTDSSHTHTEECYTTSYECGFIEHIHTTDCYSDKNADVENAAVWEKTFADFSTAQDLGEDIVYIANSQIGYKESTLNFKVDEQGIRRGYSRYGAWYGTPYSDWSANFIGFCLHYAGVSYDALPYYSGIETMRLAWENKNLYLPLSEHTPLKGEILFVDTDADGKAEVAGIISNASEAGYTVIVGDYNDSVCALTYNSNDSRILGSSVMVEVLNAMIPEEEKIRVENVTKLIDELPDIQTVGMTLMEYDANGDISGYIGYYEKISGESLSVYAQYQNLLIYRPLVSNRNELEYFSSFWIRTVPSQGSSVQVYRVNSYSGSYGYYPILVHSKSFSNYSSANYMAYWNAYYVSRDSAGFYVSKIDTSEERKHQATPPTNGFIIYTWRDHTSQYEWNVNVGDRVDINFNYLTASTTTSTRKGTVTVQNNNLKPIQSADTLDIIEINLFNYGANINDMYNSSNKYPGFQQEYGTTSLVNTDTSTTISYGEINFGNNITADWAAGKYNLTNKGGLINQVIGNVTGPNGTIKYGSANIPITGAIQFPLSADGYPVLSENGKTLAYLFSDNTYATKVNASNINGLFQIDENGNYYYDCRENHAQYNPDTNTFELYEQIITPNYAMYPFGNFLPFNNINTQSTLVTSINKAYFDNLSTAAAIKGNLGFGGIPAGYTQNIYTTLSQQLSYFSKAMGTSYTWKDVVDKYFGFNATPDSNGDTAIFNNMYNIDYDEPSDFYFGMSMEMTFIMAKDGMTGPNRDQPLHFDFNGDDDVWVYIDGKLFLDLSGIHRHVGGRIDFVNGRVEYYALDTDTGLANLSIPARASEADEFLYYTKDDGTVIYYLPFTAFLNDAEEAEFLDPETGTLKEFTQHTLNFFYMERGSGSSVCNINFNFPIIYKNSITVHKELDGEDPLAIGNPDFRFQVLKADANGNKTNELFIGAGVTYKIMDALTMQDTGKTGVTDANGVFTLKANEIAIFSGIDETAGNYYVRELLDTTVAPQYQSYIVDGITGTVLPDNVTVGGETFVGVDSIVKDISDSSNTTFTFTNQVRGNYGSFKIHKKFLSYDSGKPPGMITIEVKLDGVLIPVGTKYSLVTANGTIEKEIETEGKITFDHATEVVLFPKILAGTTITVRESFDSAADYKVTYECITPGFENNFEIVENVGVTVTIPSGEAELLITNDRLGAKLELNGEKTLLYPDGSIYEFAFIVHRINGPKDLTLAGSADQTIKVPITTSGGTQNFAFTLNFIPGTPDGTYYYQIYEENADALSGGDTSRYILEVLLTTAAGGERSATLVSVTKYSRSEINGTTIAGEGTPIDITSKLSFVNRIVRNLTLSKTVNGVSAEGNRFTFVINAKVDGTPLSGTYEVTGLSGTTSITFTNGIATIYLAHNETATILGLPYQTTYTVTETVHPGFYTRYSIDGSELVLSDSVPEQILASDSSIAFYNTGAPELPSTGSYTNLWFYFAGGMLMLTSLIGAYVLRRRRERRIK